MCNPSCQCEVEVRSGWHFRAFVFESMICLYLYLYLYLTVQPLLPVLGGGQLRLTLPRSSNLSWLCIGHLVKYLLAPALSVPTKFWHIWKHTLEKSQTNTSLCNASDLATSYILSDFPSIFVAHLPISIWFCQIPMVRFGYRADCQICENWKGEKKQQRYSGDKQPIFVRQIRDKKTGKRDKECGSWWLQPISVSLGPFEKYTHIKSDEDEDGWWD